jgi:hypothetical protein
MDSARFFAELARVFHRKGPDGCRVYSDREVRAVLFRLYWRLKPLGSSEFTQRLLGEYAVLIGLDPEQSLEEMDAAIDRYFLANPPNAALERDVERVLGDASLGVFDRAAAGLFGAQSQRPVARDVGMGRSLLSVRSRR